MRRVSDCIRDGIRLAIPQPTEWQRIGNQIGDAFIFARAAFVERGSLIASALDIQLHGAVRGKGCSSWHRRRIITVRVAAINCCHAARIARSATLASCCWICRTRNVCRSRLGVRQNRPVLSCSPRGCFRSNGIRILDSSSAVERIRSV